MEKVRVAGKTVVAVAGVGVAVLALKQLIQSYRGEEEEPFDLIDFLSNIASGKHKGLLLPAPLQRVVERIRSSDRIQWLYNKIQSSAQLKGFTSLVASAIGLWGVSLILKDVSFIDSFWSLGFLLSAYIYRHHNETREGGEIRKDLILATTAVWAIRLSGYLTWRNHGLPEDFRYQAMRRLAGSTWWIRSLFQVFLLQAVLCFLVSQPLLAAQRKGTEKFTLADKLGVAVWAIGFFFEAVGDSQLASFKKDPANKGKLLTTGLWRYSRHPNYFGNACMFWGFWVMALSVRGGWKTVYSPVLMTYLLMKVSGVPLLERSLKKRKPGFDAYLSSTSTFFPWFPHTPTSS